MTIEKTKKALDAFISGVISEYDILTLAEQRTQSNLNAKHHYGISQSMLISLIKKHQKARAEFDVKTLAKIEYRLTDINFHSEVDMLHKGNYIDAMQTALQW